MSSSDNPNSTSAVRGDIEAAQRLLRLMQRDRPATKGQRRHRRQPEDLPIHDTQPWQLPNLAPHPGVWTAEPMMPASVLGIVQQGAPIREAIDQVISNKSGGYIIIGDYNNIRNVVGKKDVQPVSIPFSWPKLADLSHLEKAVLVNQRLSTISGIWLLAKPPDHIEPQFPHSGTKHLSADKSALAAPGTVWIAITEQGDGRIATVFYASPGVDGDAPQLHKLVLAPHAELANRVHQSAQHLDKTALQLAKVPERYRDIASSSGEAIKPTRVLSAIRIGASALRTAPLLERDLALLGHSSEHVGSLIERDLNTIRAVFGEAVELLADRKQVMASDAINDILRLPPDALKDDSVIWTALGLEGDDLADEFAIGDKLKRNIADNAARVLGDREPLTL